MCSIIELLFQRQIGIKNSTPIKHWVERKIVEGGHHRACALPPHAHSAVSIALDCTDDGELIACGHGDHTVRVYESATGKIKHILTGHPRTVWSVRFAPGHASSARLLASACLDGQVKIWSLPRGTIIAETVFPRVPVACLSFSPSGERVVITVTNAIFIWDWASKNLTKIDTPCKIRSSVFSQSRHFVVANIPPQLDVPLPPVSLRVAPFVDSPVIPTMTAPIRDASAAPPQGLPPFSQLYHDNNAEIPALLPPHPSVILRRRRLDEMMENETSNHSQESIPEEVALSPPRLRVRVREGDDEYNTSAPTLVDSNNSPPGSFFQVTPSPTTSLMSPHLLPNLSLQGLQRLMVSAPAPVNTLPSPTPFVTQRPASGVPRAFTLPLPPSRMVPPADVRESRFGGRLASLLNAAANIDAHEVPTPTLAPPVVPPVTLSPVVSAPTQTPRTPILPLARPSALDDDTEPPRAPRRIRRLSPERSAATSSSLPAPLDLAAFTRAVQQMQSAPVPAQQAQQPTPAAAQRRMHRMQALLHMQMRGRPRRPQTATVEIWDDVPFPSEAKVPLLSISDVILYSDVGCAVSDCGRFVAVCILMPAGCTLRILSLQEHNRGQIMCSILLQGLGSDITAVRLAPSLRHVVAGFSNGGLVLFEIDWRRETFIKLKSVRISPGEVNSVLFIPQRAGQFVVGTSHHAPMIFDVSPERNDEVISAV